MKAIDKGVLGLVVPLASGKPAHDVVVYPNPRLCFRDISPQEISKRDTDRRSLFICPDNCGCVERWKNDKNGGA
ncbi:uncharacterized protein EI97DRAFT_53485 [Westerdykella ornata]|uniref:Uncharacterized protein n=1 Tax=Westerdykella ornata TaxID=318751 RepID=A0A6A6JI72_WESOR|nr:uncharacterized protein EI97DRAFT_53485 [Westerdykella ornata]KAF2276251.1 hypothetical protein EI97DRAFT_53485 [Westerdykella ornata]